MDDQEDSVLNPLPPLNLRGLTPARVAVGRTGVSLETREGLDFALCHALARDAVHAVLDVSTLMKDLQSHNLRPVAVHSAANDRATYLRRPDLGRRLSEASARVLAAPESSHATAGPAAAPGPLLSIVLADGLSALAVDRHALPLLDALLPRLADFTLLPVIVAEQARVALGDEVAQIFSANLLLVLIGERPGLSSPDSLGAYITWAPRQGRTDAERNCVSNIRQEGLSYQAAAAKIAFLCREAARRELTGVALKEAASLLLDEGVSETRTESPR